MRGVVVLCLIFLLTPGQEVNAQSTEVPTTNTSITEAPMTGSPVPNASSTEATNTSSTEAPMTGSPVPNASSTEAINASSTEAINTSSTEATNTSSTEATNTSSTEAINTSSTEATNTSSTEATITSSTEEPTTGTGNGAPDSGATSANVSTRPTSKPQTCTSDSCGNTTCIQLFETYACECPLNYLYNNINKACDGGKSFFGEFTISGVNFSSDPKSEAYTEVYDKVLNQSNISLWSLPDYLGTNIVQLHSLPSKSKTRSKRSTVDVIAKVNHLFKKGAAITDAEVTQAIYDHLGTFGTYTRESICGFYCDEGTTICTETADGQGAKCTCMEGRYTSLAQQAVQSCRDCSPECYQSDDKYCNMKSKAVGVCTCRPGYKKNEDKCEICEFGYSGVGCTENYQLMLVVVGVVLAAAVVALVGAVIAISVTSSKKRDKYSDRTALINEYESTSAITSPPPTKLFPKVQVKTDVGQVNSGANVFDENEEHPRRLPKTDYDENQGYEMNRRGRNY